MTPVRPRSSDGGESTRRRSAGTSSAPGCVGGRRDARCPDLWRSICAPVAPTSNAREFVAYAFDSRCRHPERRTEHDLRRMAYYHFCTVQSGASSTSHRMRDVDQPEQTRDTKQPRFALSQETITVVTVGVALAGLLLASIGQFRAEARASRARIEASMNQMRAEGRADREAFVKQITRLVEQQGTLNGLVDGLRRPIAAPEG